MKTTVKFHPQDGDDVAQLIEMLKLLQFKPKPGAVLSAPATTVAAPAPVKKEEKPKAAAPAATQPAATTMTVVKKEEPVVTATAAEEVVIQPGAEEAGELNADTIRAKIQEKMQAGKRDQIKEVLAKFGAANFSAVETARWQEFYDAIVAIP